MATWVRLFLACLLAVATLTPTRALAEDEVAISAPETAVATPSRPQRPEPVLTSPAPGLADDPQAQRIVHNRERIIKYLFPPAFITSATLGSMVLWHAKEFELFTPFIFFAAIALPPLLMSEFADEYYRFAFIKILRRRLQDIDDLMYQLPDLEPRLFSYSPFLTRRHFRKEKLRHRVARVLFPLLLHIPYPLPKPKPRSTFFQQWWDEESEWRVMMGEFTKTEEGREWLGKMAKALDAYLEAVDNYLDAAFPMKFYDTEMVERSLASDPGGPFQQESDGRVFLVNSELKHRELLVPSDRGYVESGKKWVADARREFLQERDNCAEIVLSLIRQRRY